MPCGPVIMHKTRSRRFVLLRQDRSLRLWDLRACGRSGPPGPRAATQPGLLHSFGGYRHAVAAVTVHVGTALSCSRGKVALTSLAPPHAAEVMQPTRHQTMVAGVLLCLALYTWMWLLTFDCTCRCNWYV